MKSDGLEIEATVEVDSRYDVLQGRHDALDSGDMLLFKSKRRGCRWDGWCRRG